MGLDRDPTTADVDGPPDVAEHPLFTGERLGLVERWARISTLRPWRTFGAIWAVLMVCAGIVTSQGWFDVEEESQYDWYAHDADAVKSEDAYVAAKKLNDLASMANNRAPRSEALFAADTQIIYEWSDPDRTDDILTPTNVQLMCQFERIIFTAAEFPLFCLTANATGAGTECSPVYTAVSNYFYPSEADRAECRLLSDVDDFAGTRKNLLAAAGGFFLTRSFDAEEDILTTTRSSIPLAGPLGADSTPDGTEYHEIITEPNSLVPQSNVYRDFLLDEIEPKLHEHVGFKRTFSKSPYITGPGQLGDGQLQVRFHNYYFRYLEYEEVIASDQLFIGAAVIFVGIMVFSHTRSLWVTASGLMTGLISLPTAVVVYRICQISYMGNMHLIAIFILLAINANNLFVYVDAFSQSSESWVAVRGIRTHKEALSRNLYGSGDADTEVLIARTSYALLRTVRAVFNTSFTTFGAFMATSVSPITPISTFGYFAGIAILVLYVLALLLFPSQMVIEHQRFRDRPCMCRRSKKSGDAEAAAGKESEEDAPPKHTWEEKLFIHGYIPLMERRWLGVPAAAIGGFVALLVLLIVMGNYALKMETPAERDEPFGDGHMWLGFFDDYAGNYIGGSDYMEVKVVFGIAGLDRSEFSFMEPKLNRGKPIWDEDFDLASSESQQFMLDFCDRLAELSCKPAGASKVLDGCQPYDVAVRSVDCTLRDFYDWHEMEYPNSTTPMELGDADPEEFYERLREFALAPGGPVDMIGFVDERPAFVAISYESYMKEGSPEGMKSPVIELFDDFLASEQKEAPEGLKSVLQTCLDMSWVHTEVGIVNGMYSGLAISLAVAYVVLLIATSNIFLSLFAIVSIVAIVAGVLGTAYHLGWSLGVSEAVAAVMVVGLSVDFTTHTGSMYNHAGIEGHYSRRERWHYSAKFMGPTVFAGALTTCGCSVVMFLCQLKFFSKMATLISLTMLLSLAYTFFFFLALCLLVGPQGKSGDIVHMFKVATCQSTKPAPPPTVPPTFSSTASGPSASSAEPAADPSSSAQVEVA